MRAFLFALFAFLCLGLTPAEAYRAVTSCPNGTAVATSGLTGVDAMVDLNGNICVSDGTTAALAPSGATSVQTSATGTTGATAAAIAAASSVTGYICGFSVKSAATAVATGDLTVAGILGGTLTFKHITLAIASGMGDTTMTFYPCLPASATNTAITVTSPAPGTGGIVSTVVWGYRK